MKKLTLIILSAIIILNLSGCAARGTIEARLENADPDDIKIFPATCADGELLYQGCSPNGISIFVGYIDGWARVPFILGSTIDLPTSIVADTIFLPTDIYRWNLSAKSNNEK